MNFCDLPDADRVRYRDHIEAAGGMVVGYHGDYVQVAVPREAGVFYELITAAGLRVAHWSIHYFPLGSDAAPPQLRHDGKAPGSENFWLYANLKPIEVEP